MDNCNTRKTEDARRLTGVILPGQVRRCTDEIRRQKSETMRRVLHENSEARLAAQRKSNEAKKVEQVCDECGAKQMVSPSMLKRFCRNDCAKAFRRKELGLPPEAGTTRAEIYRWRYRNDIQFRMAIILRKRIQKVVRRGMKSAATMELLGCSGVELREHLEKQFTRGMTWSNAGKWHIEHRIPCASFDLSDYKHQRICFHFTNLQPMWAAQNLAKGDKLAKHEQLPLVA